MRTHSVRERDASDKTYVYRSQPAEKEPIKTPIENIAAAMVARGPMVIVTLHATLGQQFSYCGFAVRFASCFVATSVECDANKR